MRQQKAKATTVRNRRIITDEFLIDVVTTCSNSQVALAAEIELRRRYPSRKAARKIAQKRKAEQNG